MRTYTVDFDDLCDAVILQNHGDRTIYLCDFLDKWKESTPNLKLVLYTIPRRISKEHLRVFKLNYDWVKLAPHGWEHTRGECLSWTSEEAKDKIKMARDMGIDAPIFRAPGWLLDGEVYMACHELGYTVASHSIFRVPNTGVREYVYNMHEGANPMRTRRIHGHLTPVSDNHIYDMHRDGWLKFKPKDEFVWPWEVATVLR